MLVALKSFDLLNRKIISNFRTQDNPCENGAVCGYTRGGYICKCPAGWKGDDCDEGEWYICLLYANDTCTCITNSVYIFAGGEDDNNFVVFQRAKKKKTLQNYAYTCTTAQRC